MDNHLNVFEGDIQTLPLLALDKQLPGQICACTYMLCTSSGVSQHTMAL